MNPCSQQKVEEVVNYKKPGSQLCRVEYVLHIGLAWNQFLALFFQLLFFFIQSFFIFPFFFCPFFLFCPSFFFCINNSFTQSSLSLSFLVFLFRISFFLHSVSYLSSSSSSSSLQFWHLDRFNFFFHTKFYFRSIP